MATFLDIGLIEYFSSIFPVLLVFAIVFALLSKTKVIGNSLVINALIAAVTSLTVLLSQAAIDIINFMLPWIAVAIIFFVLMILIFQMFGLHEKDWNAIIKDKTVYWAILGVMIIILVAALGNVLGQSIGPYLDEQGQAIAPGEAPSVATSSFKTNITATLFNPKVLGLIIVFTIMVFAVILLSGDTH